MKQKSILMRVAILWAAIAALVLAVGCVSAPVKVSDTPGAQGIFLRVMSPAELADEFGPTHETNPYMPPDTLLLKGKFSFYVVRMDVVSREPIKVKVTGSAADSLEKQAQTVAYSDYAAMTEFWSYLQDDQSFFGRSNAQKRATALQNYCIPTDESFIIPAGTTSYFIPFLLIRPIKPITLKVQALAEGGIPVTLEQRIVE